MALRELATVLVRKLRHHVQTEHHVWQHKQQILNMTGCLPELHVKQPSYILNMSYTAMCESGTWSWLECKP